MKIYRYTNQFGSQYISSKSKTEEDVKALAKLNGGQYEVLEVDEDFICNELNLIHQQLEEFEESFNNIREAFSHFQGIC